MWVLDGNIVTHYAIFHDIFKIDFITRCNKVSFSLFSMKEAVLAEWEADQLSIRWSWVQNLL